jgi:NADH-quinone oxidoreductase subunit J
VNIFYSYMLIIGLVAGITCGVMMSQHRFYQQRALLAALALAGFGAFLWGTLALTNPGLRLGNFYWWLFTATIIGGALGTVTMRNVFHQALMLILSLFGVTGFFILTNAEFLAMVQVIIYIGGIMVLFLFGIMVSQNIIGTELRQNAPQARWAAVLCGILFVFMFFVGLFMSFPAAETNQQANFLIRDMTNTQQVGWSLMATYSLPFEVASVLLLMAMLGAIVLVRKE